MISVSKCTFFVLQIKIRTVSIFAYKNSVLQVVTMSTDYSLHDNAFGAVLQSGSDIKMFLDAFFSFLYRRTDFYVLMKSPNDRMGFPPGIAEKLTLSAYRKYAGLAAENVAKREKQREQEACEMPLPCAVPIVGHLEEVETTSSPLNDLINRQSVNSEKSANAETTVDMKCAKETSELYNTLHAQKCELPANTTEIGELEENDPETTRQQKQYQENPDSYNGATRDAYSWSQSISDVDIRVKVPSKVRRSGDVSVEISKKHLKVAFKTQNGDFTEVVNGDLTWEIRKDESMWSLVPGEYVLVNLEKVQERWWEAVIIDEPKINVRKIDASRPITDLDDEAQTKIEELMYNEHQKRLGLPQSHEKKVHDILQQAWDAEGSPFKGQPFDPSKLNITPGSS